MYYSNQISNTITYSLLKMAPKKQDLDYPHGGFPGTAPSHKARRWLRTVQEQSLRSTSHTRELGESDDSRGRSWFKLWGVVVTPEKYEFNYGKLGFIRCHRDLI